MFVKIIVVYLQSKTKTNKMYNQKTSQDNLTIQALQTAYNNGLMTDKQFTSSVLAILKS